MGKGPRRIGPHRELSSTLRKKLAARAPPVGLEYYPKVKRAGPRVGSDVRQAWVFL